MDNKLTAIDLFCGAGGLTQGLKDAGFSVVGAVEKVELVASTYMLNHPDVKKLWNIDITELTGKEILKATGLKKGELSLLAGCPPCQGFSSMRTKNGGKKVDDYRNDLVFQMLRLIEELMPKAVLMENVPGLAKDERMDIVLSKLKKLGYHISDDTVQIHDISHYGVPQRRKRMIMLAGYKKKIPFAEPEKELKTVFHVLKDSPTPGIGNDPLHDYRVTRSDKVMDYISRVPKNGGSRSDVAYEKWLPCHQRYPKGFKDVYGRMKWESVAPTITGGCISPSKGRFLHPEEDRAITLREALLLQTFPKTYKFPYGIAREKIALMIGNALPPVYIQKHAECVKTFLT